MIQMILHMYNELLEESNYPTTQHQNQIASNVSIVVSSPLECNIKLQVSNSNPPCSSRFYSRILIGLLVGTKIYKSLVVYFLSTFLTVISSSHNYFANDKQFQQRPVNDDDAFVTNIHSPPVALFGRWSTTIQILACVQLSSGILLATLQKLLKPYMPLLSGYPTSTGKTGNILTIRNGLSSDLKTGRCRSEILSILLYSVSSSLLLLIWISALQLCGPLQTLTIGSHYDLTIAGIFSSFIICKCGKKLYGSLLFIFGIVLFLICGRTTSILLTAPNAVKHNVVRFMQESVHNNDCFVRHSVGIFLLTSWLLLRYCFSLISEKRTDNNLEKSIKLRVTFTLASGFGFLLLTFADFLDGADMIAIDINAAMCTVVVSIGLIMNYVVDLICLTKLDIVKTVRIGTTTTLVSALAISFYGTDILSADSLGLSLLGFVFVLAGALLINHAP